MGYKLAGYDVVGFNEIDPRMAKLYTDNHRPKYGFVEPIQEFKKREDLPDELYQLDILDGSPPCSSFSVASDREKSWGKTKKFREGQAVQVLDTLFFDFIDLAERLRPKVVVAENVKGLLLGEAKRYVAQIYEAFDRAGYYCQHFLLNAKYMGVPQSRERVFFVCLRKDLANPFLEQVGLFDRLPRLSLQFSEPLIPFGEVATHSGRLFGGTKLLSLWNARKWGDSDFSDASRRIYGNDIGFGRGYVYPDKVCGTLTSRPCCKVHFDQPRFLGRDEVCSVSSFPQDYDFGNQSPHYVCGMSVPPVMMAHIATQVYQQWLSKI